MFHQLERFVSRVSGTLRAESVSENPVGPGQERPHRRGQRAPLQMSRRGKSAERRVQVSGKRASNATAWLPLYSCVLLSVLLRSPLAKRRKR